MITLRKLNGSEIVVNAELIENMEPGRETVVALTNGNRYIVMESADEITRKVLEYRARLLAKVEALRLVAQTGKGG
jgi:flagellar protein FlbD